MVENNIRIITNTPLYDNNNNSAKSKVNPLDILPFDVVDPSKVLRPAKQDPSNHTSQNSLNYNPQSVLEKFIQALQTSPVLSDSLRKLLLNNQFINFNIKNDSALSGLFESFLNNISMDDKEMLNFLKFQQNTHSNFQGDFFSSLRNILRDNPDNNDFKNILGNFLKSYDCFISVDETLKSIASVLDNIQFHLPNQLKESFDQLKSELLLNGSGSDMNLTLLKKDIIPFLGRYIAKMNDFGPVRDYVSVLVHDIVRLESGLKENFSFNLDNLFDFVKYSLNLHDDTLIEMRSQLISSYEVASSNKNSIVDEFFKLIETGIKDSQNPINKVVMENISESLLFTQNVNIPLTHMFLPLNFNGMFMFSELWIDKSYEKPDNKKSKDDFQETYRAFITFDIQNIGYFESTFIMKDENLNIEILVPSSLNKFATDIRAGINDILTKNNISTSQIFINECTDKRRFNEVFTNLTERKGGINVIV